MDFNNLDEQFMHKLKDMFMHKEAVATVDALPLRSFYRTARENLHGDAHLDLMQMNLYRGYKEIV